MLQSDHLALLAAYTQFDATIGDAKFSFARERFLGVKTLTAIGSLKRQLLETLSMAGLAPPGLQAARIEEAGRRAGGSDGVRIALRSPPPPPPELLCAILASALHLAYIVGGSAAGPQLSYAIRDPKGESPEPQTAVLHPSSVNAKLAGAGWCAPYVAFHECVRTTKLYVRDASPAPLLPLLVFGGAQLELAEPKLSLAVSATMGGVELTIDGWLSVRVQPPRAAANLIELRKRVEARLQSMLMLASRTDSSSQQVVVGTISTLRTQAARPSAAKMADMAPLVGALTSLFRVEALPESAGARKGKKKSRGGGGGGDGGGGGGNGSGGGNGPNGGGGSTSGRWGPSQDFFLDPYNDVGGRGGLYEF